MEINKQTAKSLLDNGSLLLKKSEAYEALEKIRNSYSDVDEEYIPSMIKDSLSKDIISFAESYMTMLSGNKVTVTENSDFIKLSI